MRCFWLGCFWLGGLEPTLRAEQPRVAAGGKGFAAFPQGQGLLERGRALLEFGDDAHEFVAGLLERQARDIGCGVGGQSTQDENYKRLYGDRAKRLHPLTIPKLMVNAPASQISMTCGLRGPAFVVASACASATASGCGSASSA